jgi:hypothetical protein
MIWPRLEVLEAELIDCPPFAFFKIAVFPDDSLPERHTVTKSISHLHGLTQALAKEAPEYASLTLPCGQSPKELSSPGFVAQLGLYLSILSQAPEIVLSEAFRDCFQLSEKYMSRGCSSSCDVKSVISTTHSLSSCCPAQDFSSVPTTASSLVGSADHCVVDCGSASPPLEDESDDEEDLCIVCMEQRMCMAIVPCGHLSMCEACCKGVHSCPVCRGPVDKVLRILA